MIFPQWGGGGGEGGGGGLGNFGNFFGPPLHFNKKTPDSPPLGD